MANWKQALDTTTMSERESPANEMEFEEGGGNIERAEGGSGESKFVAIGRIPQH